MKLWMWFLSCLMLGLNTGCFGATLTRDARDPHPLTGPSSTPEGWIVGCETQGAETFPNAALNLSKAPTFDLAMLEYRQRDIQVFPAQTQAALLPLAKVLDSRKTFVARVIARLSLFDSDEKTMKVLHLVPSGAGLSFTQVGWTPDAELSDAWLSDRLDFSFWYHKYSNGQTHLSFEVMPFAPLRSYAALKVPVAHHGEHTFAYTLGHFQDFHVPVPDKDGLAGIALQALLPPLRGKLHFEIETVELMDEQAFSLGCLHVLRPQAPSAADSW